MPEIQSRTVFAADEVSEEQHFEGETGRGGEGGEGGGTSRERDGGWMDGWVKEATYKRGVAINLWYTVYDKAWCGVMDMWGVEWTVPGRVFLLAFSESEEMTDLTRFSSASDRLSAICAATSPMLRYIYTKVRNR